MLGYLLIHYFYPVLLSTYWFFAKCQACTKHYLIAGTISLHYPQNASNEVYYQTTFVDEENAS